jgi:hypothetical protein
VNDHPQPLVGRPRGDASILGYSHAGIVVDPLGDCAGVSPASAVP